MKSNNVSQNMTSIAFRNLSFVFLLIATISAVMALSISLNSVLLGNYLSLPNALSISFIGVIVSVLALLGYKNLKQMSVSLELVNKQAHHLAEHDALSGLPNRVAFIKQLNRELHQIDDNKGSLAVLFLDLDKFKDVNDNFGHATGDMLIVEFGQRIKALLRGSDTFARFGGDEFAIIQPCVKSFADIETLARRIITATSEVFHLDGADAFVGVSIGIATAPANASDVDSLMRLADIALYRAKNDGRNRYSFFAQDMDEHLKLRKMVEDDLRHAIEQDKLELHYQPQVDSASGKIAGFEALVRWNHPIHGSVSPAKFIPIAEERGLIVALGEWVLRRACLDALAWPSDMSVAVNVSPMQFKHKAYVESVVKILRETGINPTRVELELTEGVVVDDAEIAENAIIELRALGVRFALDDFGTGYSSLIYLRRFAFDKIKIDKSFLDQMETTGEATILVHSVVHLGRALGLIVAAEGVENEEQHRLLQAVGCHLLQGYLFSRPVDADSALKLANAGFIIPERPQFNKVSLESNAA
jgi:diguanylate cyclase